MHPEGFYRCPECGSVETDRRSCCPCGYRQAGQAQWETSAPLPPSERGFRAWLIRFLYPGKGSIFILFIGFCLISYGYGEFKLGGGELGELKVMDLRQLEAGQTPTSNYLVIRNCYPVVDSSIFETNKQDKELPDPPINYLLYPVVSSPERLKSPGKFAVLVHSKRYQRLSEVPRLAGHGDQIQGMVVNSVRGLSVGEIGLIQQQFPDRNLQEILILEEDRMPMASQKIWTMIYIGAGIMIIPIVCFILRWILQRTQPNAVEV